MKVHNDISFNSGKLRLSADRYEPDQKSSKKGAVLVHDWLGNKRDVKNVYLVRLALRLCQNGFHVLSIDCRGHGRSEGFVKFSGMIEDIAAACQFLKKEEKLTDVGVMGNSCGGYAAICAAAGGAPMSALAVWSIPPDPQLVMTRGLEKRLTNQEAGMWEEVGLFELDPKRKVAERSEEIIKDIEDVCTKRIPHKVIKEVKVPLYYEHTMRFLVTPEESEVVYRRYFCANEPKKRRLQYGSRTDQHAILDTIEWFRRWL